MYVVPECANCIFPHLKGCPVNGSKHNAACLTLYKNKEECVEEECKNCKYIKYCNGKFIKKSNKK